MAYKPSMRRHHQVEPLPLDIRPVMNLMVVLIPILLYSAVFTKLSIRELNLPPASAAGQLQKEQKPKEKEKRLFLTVLISKKGFFIGTQAAYLTGEAKKSDEPAIPLTEDQQYNFDALQKYLLEIKQKIQGQGFADENSAIISAEKDVPYKNIIKTIDYITTITDAEGNETSLFPQIIIGQVI